MAIKSEEVIIKGRLKLWVAPFYIYRKMTIDEKEYDELWELAFTALLDRYCLISSVMKSGNLSKEVLEEEKAIRNKLNEFIKKKWW